MARIAFVQDQLVEKLGVMSISAVLNKYGHECEMFCKEANKDYIRSIIAYNPDVVGCGIMTYEQRFAVQVMEKVKQANGRIVTILGGHHPTAFPDIINQGSVDIVCRGEGEFSVLELMNCIDKKQDYSSIEGLWVKKEGKIYKNSVRFLIQDLDSLPRVDREIYYKKYPILRNMPTKAFISLRGCPFQCSFCFNNVYARIFKDKGTYLRFRKPESVIEEILYVKEKYGLDWVQFHDSTFNGNYRRTETFLRDYAEKEGLPGFICNIRHETLDERLVSLMKKAGCNKVTMGIEHGNEGIRRNLARRGGDQSSEKIIQACKLLKKNNIRVYTDFILGWPGETVKEAFESIRLSRLIKPDGINTYILAPFPGTDIEKYSIERGYLDSEVSIEDITSDLSHENRCILKQPYTRELINIHKLFHMAVFHPRFDPLTKLLIKLPPNKAFTFIHGLPALKRTLKYDKKSWKSKIKYILQYIKYIFSLK